MQPTNRRVLEQIVLIGVLLAFVIVAFFTFIEENNERIVAQNENYVEAAARQMAAQVDSVLENALDSIQLIAYLYGQALPEGGLPEGGLDRETLSSVAEQAMFDYVEFVDRGGMNLTAEGQLNVLDEEYYIEGMAGASGICVAYGSGADGETLVIFYAPLRTGGEIAGVMLGVYREEHMREILDISFFGVRTDTYLCAADGTVISAGGEREAPENIILEMSEYMPVSSMDRWRIWRAFEEHSSIGYTYENDSGTGSAYLAALSREGWMLIQSFPPEVTDQMRENADAAGIRLEIKLLLISLAYIAALIFWNWKQKRQLVSRNQEISGIVNGVTRLFSRFTVVDLEKDTYEYLEEPEEDVPVSGKYSELTASLLPRYLEGENGAPMSKLISSEYICAQLTEDTPYLQYEYRIDGGVEKWEQVSILCLKRDGTGTPVRLLFAIQDVTALKEEERQSRLALKNAFEAAEEANRAKSDFLARMSHDIRTPMNAIMGMTTVARMHLNDEERLEDCLDKISVSSSHLLSLINDVLDMSKIESGKVTLTEEEFNLAEQLEGLFIIIQPQAAAKGQRFRVSISHFIHEDVIGDALRLRQVLVNILGNAVKFTPEGGTISFHIEEVVSLIPDQGCYQFVCEDTGIGMEPEFLDKVFEPFARSQCTAASKIEGTGLGMSITRNIVRMMNGDIRVESQAGVGSKFTVQVYLPLQDVEAQLPSGLAGKKALVVDSDREDRESACEFLDSVGMEAIGIEAADQAAGLNCAVAVVAWELAGMSGAAAVRTLRAQLDSQIPILVLTSGDWTEIEREAREAGADEFLEKPLFRSRLLQALQKALAEGAGAASSGGAGGTGGWEGKRILLVEDNELNREIARELLTSFGTQVEEAQDGEQAVKIAAEKPAGYYDLIFMDIQMPVMDGYEAAESIRRLDREDLKRVPIVAMSANAFSDDIQRALDSGMNDHVAKPVEVDKLLAALEKWLG